MLVDEPIDLPSEVPAVPKFITTHLSRLPRPGQTCPPASFLLCWKVDRKGSPNRPLNQVGMQRIHRTSSIWIQYNGIIVLAGVDSKLVVTVYDRIGNDH